MTDEQKAALDLAILNLKTHGDDQLLSAVQPLIEFHESRVLAERKPVAEVIKWQTFTGHTAWDLKVFDKTLEHGAKLYAAPLAQSAEPDRIDAERWRYAMKYWLNPIDLKSLDGLIEKDKGASK